MTRIGARLLIIGAAVVLPLSGGAIVAQSIVSAAEPPPPRPARSPAALRSVPVQPHLAGEAGTNPFSCPLQRIGTQFVRCDNLTGAGALAPSYVPEYLMLG